MIKQRTEKRATDNTGSCCTTLTKNENSQF
jgi:hypothetical protein